MSDNVVKIAPFTGFTAGINEVTAAKQREIADWIADGEYGNVRNVVVLIENEEGELRYQSYGNALDTARLVGLIYIAAARIESGRL